jgi:hypothetical protein
MSSLQERPRPRSGSIRDACSYSGLGRSSLYKEAAKHPGLFRKWNGRTIVDFNILDSIIDALPPAEIKLPHLALSKRGECGK